MGRKRKQFPIGVREFPGVTPRGLDGKAIDLKSGAYAASIPAGDHTLTVEVDGNAPYFKAQCDDASFLGD